MARLVDLSVAALKNNTMDPNDVKITPLTHTASSRRMAKGVGVFAEVIGPFFCANDNVEALTHAGTHVDAPYHFGPIVEGKPAKKIDEVPVEWCYGNGVLLDFSSTKKSGEAITVNDLEQELKRINDTLKPMDIVLIRTGAEEEVPTRIPVSGNTAPGWFANRSCGFSTKGSRWLEPMLSPCISPSL